MPGINQVVKDDPKKLREYNKRRRQMRAVFNALPRGAQARCAVDLAIAPISVSKVLSGLRISESTLQRIEVWAREQDFAVVETVK